jgi:hypothetical protein
VSSGQDVSLLEHQQGVGLYAISPDGKTLYVTTYLGSSRLQLLTNFADRPRLP